MTGSPFLSRMLVMKLKTLKDAEVDGKRVLVRADLNVPAKDGKIADDTRLRAFLPTLKYLVEKGAKVIVMTHFGRPKGRVVEELRVEVIAKALGELLGKEVKKLNDCIGDEVEEAVGKMAEGDVVMLENTRFHARDEENDAEFVGQLAGLAELFVSDGFGALHRAHASTVGVAELLPSYAGFLVEKEVEVLSGILDSPKKPVCLVMGGAKIDTKIGILEKFLGKADYFLIGGALANTFLAAEGYEVGISLYEQEKMDTAREFLMKAEVKEEYVYLPADVRVADEISEHAVSLDVKINAVTPDMKILDIGVLTVETFVKSISEAGTIIWNGPMGLYEYPQFAKGSEAIARAISESEAISIVGGGDSIDAINNFGLDHKKFTHISTGGGAMLEFLEGKKLPGLAVLAA